MKQIILALLLKNHILHPKSIELAAVEEGKRNFGKCLIGRVEDLEKSYLIVKYHLPWLAPALKPSALNGEESRQVIHKSPWLSF